MEFTAGKSELLRELDLAQGVAEKKTTIPILSSILLEVSESKLTVSATDLDLGLRCECAAHVKSEGAVTVPGKRLLEVVRSLPEAEIKFKALENHYVQLNCQRSSFKLAGMPRDNFPALPDVPAALAIIPAGTLAPMLRRTNFAISGEESRYTINGALLVLTPDKVSMVATDGHRLAQTETDAAVGVLNNEFRILVPKKAVVELQRLFAQGGDQAPVHFSKNESHLFFSVGHRLLISRLLNGQFPNYEAVIPHDNKRVADIDKAKLSEAIHRVALLADERSRVIRLQIDSNRIEMSGSSGEYGEAHDELDAEYMSEPMQIGFNYQYLIDFLDATGESEKIRLELKDEQSAGQFRPLEDDACRYRYVVMPMRV